VSFAEMEVLAKCPSSDENWCRKPCVWVHLVVDSDSSGMPSGV
jgi:hypothetical protein